MYQQQSYLSQWPVRMAAQSKNHQTREAVRRMKLKGMIQSNPITTTLVSRLSSLCTEIRFEQQFYCTLRGRRKR